MKKKIALATLATLPFTVNSAHASDVTGIVTIDYLNVRSGPGTNHSISFSLKKNEVVYINQTSNGWYNIKTNDGRQGWASSSHISTQNNNIEKQNIKSNQKRVTVDNLNLRSGAGTSYRVITTLNKGEVLEFVSESNGWAKVKHDGRLGYVSSQYIENVENSSSKTSKYVNTNGLNVRSGPSTSYSVLGKLNKNEKVQVLSESNGWSKIEYKGKMAYVSSRYLSSNTQTQPPTTTPPPTTNPGQVKETKYVNTNGLNVRSGPSTSNSKIGTLNKGAKVGVISESNGWSKIEYQGKVAYVASRYLDKVEDSKPTPPPTTPEEVKETKVVNTNGLNVRSGPSTSNSKIGTLNKGAKVGVISESNGWSKIKYKEKAAYVASKYLDKIEDSKPTPPPVQPPTTNPDDNNNGDSSENINGATITYKGLGYTLNDHVKVQLDRVSVGGNVIHSSKPRSSEMLSTFSIRETRAFIPADSSDLSHFLNPDNFKTSSKGMMQFLRIDSYKGGVSASELNSYLNSLAPTSSGTNVFYNQGQAFINAAQKYNLDLAYLVSHAMWETGYGKSTLAQGQTITSFKGNPLPEPVTVYNFFGIGAIDKSANVSGAEAAYSNGWTSIEKTIEGSAQWIASNYIKSSKYNQNTIYKMKFNYDYSWHQYATDVNWANGISGIMNTIVKMYDSGNNLVFEVPEYK